MVVSSIKCCWSKFSARVRDYYFDYYYRPEDEVDGAINTCPNSDKKQQHQTKIKNNKTHHYHHHHHHHHIHNNNQNKCNRSCAKDTNNKLLNQNLSNCCINNKSTTSSHSNNRHQQTLISNNDSCQHHDCLNQNQRQTQDGHQYNCRQPIIRGYNDGNHITLSRIRLPIGYTKKITSQGQVYFSDQQGQKYWFDPRVPKELLAANLDLDNIIGKLSTNWEIRQTSSGKTYYVNHTKKTTQFTDPRLVAYKEHLMIVLERMNYIRFPKQPLTYSQQSNNNINNQNQSLTSSRVPNSDNLLNKLSAPPNSDDQNAIGREFLLHNVIHNNSNNQQQQQQNSTLTRLSTNNVTQPTAASFSTATTTTDHNYIDHHNNTIHDFSSRRKYSRHNRPDNYNIPSIYRSNPLSGSHHNLSTATTDTTETNHSNTLTGMPPAWLRAAYETRKKQQQQQQQLQPQPINNTNTNTLSNNRQPQQPDSALRLSSYNNNNTSQVGINSTSANNTIYEIKEHNDQKQQLRNSNNNNNNNNDLNDKISILRQELLKQQVSSHPCRIDISRKRIFEESFRVISQMQPRDLKKRLLVKFKGEEGLDYGGVAREWFYLLSREILNPIHGLFQYTSDDIYNLQINPDSGIVYREHLSYLNFCGRVIGMAVFHGHFIEGHFTLPFYKMLLRKPITLADIEFVDPDLYRSLCWILENDITNVIDTTFLVQHNAFGQLQEHELKDGGRNIVVTEDNKHEYVSLYVNYRCRRGIESQFEALQRGFYELIIPNLVENFNEHELELLIGGLSKINYDDWKLNTKLKNCNVDTPLVRWFWDIVKSYGEDKRARLLQFVTGSPRVPIQGFKALQGVNSEVRLFTIHLIKNACTDNLPKSHTCFNRIDLPPYETYDKLRDKLTQAIEETMGFAMQ